MTGRLRLLVIAALLGAFLASGQAQADDAAPFQIPAKDLVRIDKLVADAVAGKPQALGKTLARDPFLDRASKELKLDQAIAAAATGNFDSKAFLNKARRHVARRIKSDRGQLLRRYQVYQVDMLRVMLETKLESLANYLDQAQKRPSRSQVRSPRSLPTESRAVRSIFGNRSRKLGMAPAQSPHLVRGASSALGQYGFLLAPKRKATAASSARIETGRAIYAGDVPVRGRSKATTEILIKGVGPTPYAGNVFNSENSGSFPLEEGKQDWDNTLALKKAGIPVYEPVALVGLPYWEFSKDKGFKPLAIYARKPQENLRISDLGILSTTKRRQVADQLRGKIAALSNKPAGDISRADVIRFVAARLGRVAGLFEGGKTFGGKRYFHGMLHLQNVSLLGEIVDLGHNEGLMSSEKALQKAYKKSGYVRRDRNWPKDIQRAKTERAVLEYMVTAVFEDLGEALPKGQRPTRAEITAIFARAYREGRAGKRASSTSQVLSSARKGLKNKVTRSVRGRLASSSTRRRPPSRRSTRQRQQTRRKPAARARSRAR
ncbi:MAG: hypothetical protein KJO07_01400 [Deltaproteobacteria bacterium]|nr:hypothetical protein [Deltaproteobacteria bacterium]